MNTNFENVKKTINEFLFVVKIVCMYVNEYMYVCKCVCLKFDFFPISKIPLIRN